MRDLVNRPSFLLRKKLDNVLYAVLPDVWVPLYNSVTFSDMRYSECVRNRVWQDQVLFALGAHVWRVAHQVTAPHPPSLPRLP